MFYSEEQVQQLNEEHLTIVEKYAQLLEDYAQHNFDYERAREFAEHGFLRRLKTVVRSIDKVFEILPPDRASQPSDEELTDAAIYLQASVLNVFGCVDNLAWIWVCEKNLTKADGSPLPDQWVGLGRGYREVRKSFSPEFRTYLNELGTWFAYIENFRHALAHRIPLYVPPYVVDVEGDVTWKDLDKRKWSALNRGDIEEYDRLAAEQDALGVFQPFMMHSYLEKARQVCFHPQLFSDFNTIEELGRKMLKELEDKGIS